MSKKIIIPIEVVSLQGEGFHLFVQGKLDGIVLRLLIDTGASKTVFDKKFIAEKFPALALQQNEMPATGVSSHEIQSEITEVKNLSLGKLKIETMVVAILDLEHVNHTYESIQLPSIHGVIGCDFLVEHNANIKLKKNELLLKKRKQKMK